MATPTPPRSQIHAEMERARRTFHTLIEENTRDALSRPSKGTRWTNRQLLFHMLFGYLVTRTLRPVVKIASRLPEPIQRGFARLLDSATHPFDQINYLGSCTGAWVLTNARMGSWCDRTIAALHRQLDSDGDPVLARSMAFPVRWDPYFAPRMSLADVYHYASVHFDHHRRQLTLDEHTGAPGP